jgi:hypothetical protein
MAARSTDPTRLRLNGPDAQRFIGVARTQMGILKESMGFGNLPQLSRTVTLADGTRIFVQSVFGQDTIRIDRPVGAVEEVVGAGVTGAVNRVADYVSVAMPNPVPYRGVSIGVVDRGVPTMVAVNTGGGTVDPGVYGYNVWAEWRIDIKNSAGVLQGSFSLRAEYYPIGYGSKVIWTNYCSLLAGWISYANPTGQPAFPLWEIWSGTVFFGGSQTGAWSVVSPSYEELLASDQAAGTGGVRTYVMASDGTVLASEVQNTTVIGGHTHVLYNPIPYWSGGSNLWMGDYDQNLGDTFYHHQVPFIVPEDCAYPTPPDTPPSWFGAGWATFVAAGFNTDWATGVTAFKARRKAWFLKNSTEFIAALKGKFQPGTPGVTRVELQTGMLPASWDYQIKRQISAEYSNWWLADGSNPGRHTKMPIIMDITYTDTVQSDTSAGLTQAGTMVTQRAATFQYVDAGGVNRTATVNGTETMTVTEYMKTGAQTYLKLRGTWRDWYQEYAPAIPGSPGHEELLAHQFLRDRSNYGLAQMWTGSVQEGENADSAFGTPGNTVAFTGYTPPYPAYSNTLVGTAATLYLQYHNTVLPQYVKDTAQSSTVMNNSAMYNVRQIELCLFGPAPGGQAIGIFPDPTDADGATQIAYYGEASLRFDWTTGGVALMGWNPRKDANGNETPAIVPMPAGYSYHNSGGTLYFNNGASDYTPAYNCAVGYVWDSPEQMWPDVAEYLRLKIAAMLSGGGDQVLYTIIKQALVR